MSTMPDYAVRAAFDEVLSEEVDARLLALVPGTVVSHPLKGGTEVVVRTTARNVLQVTEDLQRVATHLWGIAGVDPVALSIDPVALSTDPIALSIDPLEA
ncbi:hypothetical protein [Terrabacter sp. BE26]|uniref:hypothetical protein n=1 Tax=Terrabacter sp. BE26 TaxID=2898152 RepID=UPI0035BE1645